MTYCNVNGRISAAEDALISIQNRGFRFGDGVFETLRVHAGVPYRFEWHMTRLAAALRAVRIDFDSGLLHNNCKELLHKNGFTEGLLRIQVTRGDGGQGYLPGPSEPLFVIETLPHRTLPVEPVSLWLSRYAKISPHALPVQYKLCQGMNSTLARMEAGDHDCFDALLMNEAGHICETSSGNIFWFKGGKLYTPALSCGVLEGATRSAIIQLSPSPVMEVEAKLDALSDAESIFVSNVAWQAIGVGNILPTGIVPEGNNVVQTYQRLLNEDCMEYCQKHRKEWVHA